MDKHIKMKQIMLVNMGGLGNIGDRAMALNIIRQFREQAPEINLLVGAHTNDDMVSEFNLVRYPLLFHCFGRTEVFEKKLKFLSIIKFALRPTLYIADSIFVLVLSYLTPLLDVLFKMSFMEYQLARAINNSDALFFCGGGYINDLGTFEARSNLILALLAKLRGKKVIMSGQGLGPFYKKSTKLLLKIILPKVDIITFRDKENSSNIIQTLHIKCKYTESVGDDATTLPEKITTHKIINKKIPRIAVNIRISPFTANFSKKTNLIKDLLFELSNNYNFHIDFFIFETWRPWEVDLVNKMIQETNIVNYDIHKTEDPRIALSILKNCDIAIGISYHFIVFGLKCGIPSIGIYSGEYYKSKMHGLLEWYEKTEWAIDIDNVELNELLLLCTSLHLNKDIYKDKLIEVSNNLSIQTSKIIPRTLELLNKI